MTRKVIEAFGGDANAAPSRSDESAGPATRDAPNTPQVTDKAPLIGLSQGEGERLADLIRGRDGVDFDGEVHLTSAEGQEIIAALSGLSRGEGE